jgi:hypothetical protein
MRAGYPDTKNKSKMESVGVADSRPVPASVVHYQLIGLQYSQLHKKDAAALSSAFNKAHNMVDSIAKNGGFFGTGNISVATKGFNKSQYRIDIAYYGTHNIIQ